MNVQLLKSTTLVSFMTLISRVLGFVRDMVTAYLFGPGMGVDAFVVASKIPNFMRRLFAEGAFSQAFVPILSEYRHKTDLDTTRLFIDRVTGALSTVLLGITALGVLAAPCWVMLFAPGFSQDTAKYTLTVEMLRLTFPYLFFISLTAMAGGILNAYGKFAVPAFTPVFLNLSLIGAALWLAPYCAQPIEALAWGTLIGGVVQLGFQVPFLARLRLLPRFRVSWQDPGVKRVMYLMFPALLGVSVNQLNLLLSTLFASFLPTGSVSWLYYAERLMEFPSGGFGVALATVVLPHLSRHRASANKTAFSQTVDWGLRWVLLVALPAAIGLGVMAGPLIVTLFMYKSGRFDVEDAVMTRQALWAYAPGVMGFMLAKVLASAYYACQDIKTPVKIAMATVVVNIVGNLTLVSTFAHQGLAMATSLSALFNAATLGIILLRRQMIQPEPGWSHYTLRLLASGAAMAIGLYIFSPELPDWIAWSTAQRVAHLAGLIAMGMLLYGAMLWVTGLRKHHLLQPLKPQVAAED